MFVQIFRIYPCLCLFAGYIFMRTYTEREGKETVQILKLAQQEVRNCRNKNKHRQTFGYFGRQVICRNISF